MSTRKIAAWHAAGLIDAETRDRIMAYEAAHARPLALWAVFGIGALAIALGLVSVIAANWEDIPGQLRLGIHLALIAAALVALFFGEKRMAQASPWAVEALVFVTAALGLTFFGHIGQVYQTSSPLWKPLAAWLVLFAPLLLLTGRSWPTALAVVGGSVWCAWSYAGSMTGFGGSDTGQALQLWVAFVTALPVLYAPLAAGMRDRSDRPDFWRRVEQAALAYGVAGASLATAVAGADVYGETGLLGALANSALSGAVGVAAGLGTMLARPGVSGRMSGAIMAGAGLIVPLAHMTGGLSLPSALLFFALWGGIAAAALAAHWRGVFQLAVGAIALRLIILSFELASDLLLSGFGLILSGFLILGVAWVAVRVSKTFAPSGEAAA
jgi:uncharacterized membrane protein